jgi:hypothetical protein
LKIKIEGAYKQGFKHVILPLGNVVRETGQIVEHDYQANTPGMFDRQLDVPVRLSQEVCMDAKLYPIDNIFDCLDLVLNHKKDGNGGAGPPGE